MARICKHLLIAIVGGALLSSAAQARMYQWQSTTTGAAQVSGEPPAWYRSERGGPRVRVFESGNLVDDTAITLPRAQREELRDEAFRELEQRQRAESLKRLERLARQQQRREAAKQRLAKKKSESRQRVARQSADDASESQSSEPVDRSDAALDEASVARLKAIISEFDRNSGK